MKLDLLKITAICLQGRKSDFDNNLISRVKKNLTYMTHFFNFKEIIYISDINPEVEGVKFIHTDPISYYEYNKWCLHNISDYINSDYALLFQDDGWPINPECWSDEFLDYDYVGAPIGAEQKGVMFHPEDRIGGGGFTLRSKRFMEFTKNFEFLDEQGKTPNEDTFITCMIRNEIFNNGMKICPYNIARKFVVQMPIDNNHTIYNSFGYHGRTLGNLEISDSIISERLKSLMET